VRPGQRRVSTARSVRGPQAADLPLSALADDQIASLSDGALVVTLTSGNDSLSVARNTTAGTIEVTVNGSRSFRFRADQVRNLIIRALEADDVISLDPNLSLPTFVDGGPGTDTVTGWPDALPAPVVHTPDSHAPRGNPYQLLSVENVATSASAARPVLDYSAHLGLEHSAV